MNKLIQLLREFPSNDAKVLDKEDSVIIDTGQEFVYGNRIYLYETIISKKFGFIKWLVDNDKIDEYKVFCDQKEYFILQVGNDNYNSENYLVDGLLMLLSISDTPIDDLISYLK